MGIIEGDSVVTDESQEPSPRDPHSRLSPSTMAREPDREDDNNTLPSQTPSEFSLPRSLFSVDTGVSQSSKKRTRQWRDPLNDVGLMTVTANGGHRSQEREYGGEMPLAFRRTDPLLGQEIQPTHNRESPISFLDPSMTTAALNNGNTQSMLPARSASGTMDASQTSARSKTLVPAATTLKRNLKDSKQRLNQLQEEHANLNSAYSDLQNLHEEQGVALRNGLQAMQEARNRYHLLTEEHKAAKMQHQSESQRLQDMLIRSDNALQMIESEKDQLLQSHELVAARWESDLNRAQEEKESLKSELNSVLDKLKQYSKIEEENIKLQGKISKCNQTIESKHSMISSLEGDLAKIREAYKERINRLDAESKSLSREVVSAKGQVETAKESSQSTIRDLQSRLSNLEDENLAKTELYKQTLKDKATLEVELTQAKSLSSSSSQKIVTLEQQLRECQEELQVMNTRFQETSTSEARTLEQVRKASENKIKSLELENDRLRAVQKEFQLENKNERGASETEIADLKARNCRIRDELDDANIRCKETAAELQSLQAEIRKQHKSSSEIGCQTIDFPIEEQKFPTGANGQTDTESPNSVLEPPYVTRLPRVDSYLSASIRPGISHTMTGLSRTMTDRGGRFRDVAERVQIDYQYQLEVKRLRDEHQKEMTILAAKHDQILKQVTQDAKHEASSRAKDYKRKLQSEYESEIEELCRKHDEQISQIKNQHDSERDHSQLLNNQIAVELQTAGQDLEYTEQARAALEDQMSNLKTQLVHLLDENKIWRSKWEVLSHRRGNEGDFAQLLERIRKDCSAALERQQQPGTSILTQSSSPEAFRVDDIIRTVSTMDGVPYQRTRSPSPTRRSAQSIWRKQDQSVEMVQGNVANMEALLRSLD